MIPSQRQSSTALRPAAQDADSTSVRSRNRRIVNTSGQDAGSSLSTPNRSPSRGASPIPSARIGGVTGRNNARVEYAPPPARGKNLAGGRGLVDSSWAPSWASVQGFATSIISGSSSLFAEELDGGRSRDASRTRATGARNGYGDSPKLGDNWGPEPPSESTPRLGDVGAGSRAQRDARLKAMKTASVLESHDSVNRGLDVAGSFKKRRSDEDLRSSSQSQEEGDHLVYIHHVQPVDTYAGIVLKYRCHEDAFRKANGLWSRDSIQTRKWLVIPVDACEVRGRLCEDPAFPSARVDLLAQTPDVTDQLGRTDRTARDDFFSPSTTTITTNQSDHPKTAEEQPWTHVRWVSLDSFPSPVEIARVPRKALGYFPPRRKKSLVSGSLPSTPRGSVEVPSITLSAEGALESPRSTSSRRPSLLSSRPQISGIQSSGRNRLGSTGEDARPAWMRRPGGVGSLGRSVRTPGPAKDYFNTWTRKHLPGLNIDSLPSMSVMGAETARFGFGGTTEERATIAESPFEEGRDTSALGNQSTGLDKAALTVETWLRSAFSKHPGTPILGPRGRSGEMEEGDLIELTDTNSDDGRGRAPGEELGLLGSAAFGSSGWSTADGRGAVRGRNGGGNVGKANKSD